MSYNIGPKIGIDGEKEFRDSIKRINDTYKALEAETRAVTAAMDAQGDEQGKLEATSKQLQKQIDNQKSKMALLEDAVKKASDKFGENSLEATRLRGALYDAQATVSKLENELKDTTSQLDNLGGAMDELAEETDEAGDAVLSFGDVLKANLASSAILDVLRDVGEAVINVAEDSIDAAADIRAASAQFEQAFGDMADAAEDSLDAISDETKIAVTRMQESYTKIFAFTKSVGAESEEALDIASRAMRAAADSAAYYDKTVEEASETLQAFLKGNYANDAALGIAATETTRNAKANELYAKSFKDLSESQKVDVLLSMVEAGNAASGALGQAAREAGEWTNVNGELAESWRQFLGVIGDPLLDAVIPAVQGATGAIKRMTEELSTVSAPDALAESMKDFEKSIEDANDRLAQTEDEIYTAAFAAEHYADRLAELETAGLDNAVAQREYALVVEELNKLVPNLNLTIDEQTGLVNKNIDAIRGDIAAWQEYALAAAMQEKFSETLRAQAAAEADLIEAKARKGLLEKDEEILSERLIEKTSELTAAQIELNNAQRVCDGFLSATNEGWAEANARLNTAKARVQELTGEQTYLEMSLKSNTSTQRKLANEIADAEKTLDSYSDQIALAEEANKLYSQSADETSDSMDRQAAAVAEAEASVAAIRQAYSDAKQEAYDSISSQIGLFEELTLKSDYSAEKILENWEKQQKAFADYSDNLQKAVDMGLDEVLVQQLSDGSQQSMMILDALVNDTEISIDEINAAFGSFSEGKDALATTMAEVSLIVGEGLADLPAAFKTAGINAIDGLILGVTSRQDAFRMSLAGVGNLGIASFNEALAIRSPARKMIPSGEFTVDGAIVGVENRIKAYENVMSDLALAGENAYLTAQLERVGSYPSMVQAPASYSRSVAHHYGGINIEIHQQPGESGEDLAYRVMEIMQHEVEAKEAGIGA